MIGFIENHDGIIELTPCIKDWNECYDMWQIADKENNIYIAIIQIPIENTDLPKDFKCSFVRNIEDLRMNWQVALDTIGMFWRLYKTTDEAMEIIDQQVYGKFEEKE